MSKVYLSGPITGLEYGNARYGWRLTFSENLGPGIEALSPMRHEGHLAEMKTAMSVEALKAFEKEKNHIFSHPKMIVSKDMLDIEQSDLMVVNFLGAKDVSQGTIWEMGYAKGKGKQIVVITDSENVHKSPFIRESANVVVDNLDDAILIVNSLLSTGV